MGKFVDMQDERFTLGRPMRDTTEVHQLSIRLGRFKNIAIICALIFDVCFIAARLIDSQFLLNLFDSALVGALIAVNAITIGVVISYYIVRTMIYQGLKNNKIYLVRIATALSLFFSYLSLFWGLYSLVQLLKALTFEIFDDIVETIAESFKIVFTDPVNNFLAILSMLAALVYFFLALLIFFTLVRIATASTLVFFETFRRLTEGYRLANGYSIRSLPKDYSSINDLGEIMTYNVSRPDFGVYPAQDGESHRKILFRNFQKNKLKTRATESIAMVDNKDKNRGLKKRAYQKPIREAKSKNPKGESNSKIEKLLEKIFYSEVRGLFDENDELVGFYVISNNQKNFKIVQIARETGRPEFYSYLFTDYAYVRLVLLNEKAAQLTLPSSSIVAREQAEKVGWSLNSQDAKEVLMSIDRI